MVSTTYREELGCVEAIDVKTRIVGGLVEDCRIAR